MSAHSVLTEPGVGGNHQGDAVSPRLSGELDGQEGAVGKPAALDW